MQTPENGPGSGEKHYTVDKSPRCQKQLEKMESRDRRRVEAKLAALAMDPRPPGVAKL